MKDTYESDDILVEKKNVLSTVQKRMGTALVNKQHCMIDKLQNYYWIANRSNVGNLEEMKKAIAASLVTVLPVKHGLSMNTALQKNPVGVVTTNISEADPEWSVQEVPPCKDAKPK